MLLYVVALMTGEDAPGREREDWELLRIDSLGVVVVAGAKVGWWWDGGGEPMTEEARSEEKEDMVGVLGLGLDIVMDMVGMRGVPGGEMSMARSCATVMLAPCLGINGARGCCC